MDGKLTDVELEADLFNMGDRRLNIRGSKMIEQMAKKVGNSLPGTFSSEADLRGAYRFLDNDLVSPEKILAPHKEQTIRRCQDHALVAVLQDSSDLSFDYLKELEGFFPMQSNVQKGYRIHPSLVISEQGTSLGVLGADNYSRDPGKISTKHRNSTPIEEKESYRWLKGVLAASELAQQLPETTVVSISDREGDIYECFAEAEDASVGEKAHVLIRSQHNRMLEGTSDETTKRLNKELAKASLVYETEVAVNTDRATSRTATVSIRACSVKLSPPATAKKKGLSAVRVNAVLVSEENPPSKTKALKWLLLTTLQIDSVEEVRRIVHLYSQRWKIETFFKVLKSGMGIDSRFLQSRPRIEKYIALAMIVAWRVMLTTYLPRECPEAPCTVLFSDREWKLLFLNAYKEKRPLPSKPPTLKEAVMYLAMLGGYKKRKTPPGAKLIWKGTERLMDMIFGYEMMTNLNKMIQE